VKNSRQIAEGPQALGRIVETVICLEFAGAQHPVLTDIDVKKSEPLAAQCFAKLGHAVRFLLGRNSAICYTGYMTSYRDTLLQNFSDAKANNAIEGLVNTPEEEALFQYMIEQGLDGEQRKAAIAEFMTGDLSFPRAAAE